MLRRVIKMMIVEEESVCVCVRERKRLVVNDMYASIIDLTDLSIKK